jgi:hypothetical protein
MQLAELHDVTELLKSTAPFDITKLKQRAERCATLSNEILAGIVDQLAELHERLRPDSVVM